LKLQISIATDKTVKELKEAIAKTSNVEAERQRLIYSGKLGCNGIPTISCSSTPNPRPGAESKLLILGKSGLNL
jgi:hypothetical protein